MGFIKALKKEKNLFRLNRRSNMHVKWMGKMAVVVKCRFLVILIERLHQFFVVKPIKIHMQIEELSNIYPVVKSACLYLSLLKFDSLSNMSGNEGHSAVV